MDQNKKRMTEVAKVVSPLLIKASQILGAEINSNNLGTSETATLLHIQDLIEEGNDQMRYSGGLDA